MADIDSSQIRHGIPWTKTFGSTNIDDPLLYILFREWLMRYMNSSLTNLRPKDENSTHTQQTYNKKLIKDIRMVIIDIVLYQTPNPDLSNGPEGGYGVVLFLK